ncbi:MAG: hypothetical protein PHR44_06535 [Candidatus Omnitrophica bacterium]|nr:hypothetical protein [Candidatus Omnitrophota bacterium]
MKSCVAAVISFLLLSGTAFCADVKWQDSLASQVNSKDINQVIFGGGTGDLIAAATAEGLYFSDDSGAAFKKIFHYFTEDKGDTLSAALKANLIFAGTKNGLYISHNSGKNWVRAYGGLRGEVFKAVVAGEYVYAVSEEGLFVSKDDGRSWERIFLGGINRPDEEADSDEPSGDTEEMLPGEVNALGFIGGDEAGLALGSRSGLYTLEFTGSGILISKVAILSGMEITGIAPSGDDQCLYVSGRNTVYKFWHANNAVEQVDSGREFYEIKGLAFNSAVREYFVIDRQGIYEQQAQTGSVVGNSVMFERLKVFGIEPTIEQLHRAAIEYAEVSPAKITHWRRKAAKRAFLPTMSIGYDRSISDTYEIYTSATKDYIISGPRDRTDGWDVNLAWDLGDWIYNEHQTSIDVRSRLMVELRNDILEDLDRLYFERRRLQNKLTGVPGSRDASFDDLMLRIDELTARIDSLTGGYLSRYIEGRG